VAQLFSLGIIAHTMKKTITIGFTVALLIIVALLSWQHFKPSRDAKIRKNLPGIWVVNWGKNHRSTSTISPDGSYVCQITGSSDGTVVTVEGTFQVRDGFLIDTMTKSSQTTTHVPNVSRGQIIRADAHEMAISFDGGNGESVFRKDTR
jgi:hypothetical protein